MADDEFRKQQLLYFEKLKRKNRESEFMLGKNRW